MEHAPLLETKKLKKFFATSRGTLHAVDDVDLVIQPSQTLGVVGESGCGKSTLGKTILQLTNPTSGEILFHGRNIVGLSKREIKNLRRNMQMVFQDPYSSLDPRMSVSQLIEDPMIVYGVPKSERLRKVRELMDIVGLAQRFATAYPHELDGGRRQRIGIARALSLDPEFIVCDEPVSALDVSIQAQILNLLKQLQREMGLTYVFITHDLSVVKYFSDDIAVMYLGQMVEKAPSAEIFAHPTHPYTQALLSAIPIPVVGKDRPPRKLIRGEITSPVNLPDQCRFLKRCDACQECCQTGKNPQLVEISPQHFVACHLAK